MGKNAFALFALVALAGMVSVDGHAGHSMKRADLGSFQHSVNSKQSNLALRSVASELGSSASFCADDSEVECTSTFCDEVCTCKPVEFTASKRADWAPKPLRRSSSVTSALNVENSPTINSYSAAHSMQGQQPRMRTKVDQEFTRLQANLFPHIAF